MASGIYCLLFSSNYYYIGKSTDISRRYKEHIKAMKNDTAFNNIQKQYNIYGIPELLELECVPIEELFNREHYWISMFIGPMMLNVYTNGNDNAVGPENPNAKYTKQQLIDIFLDIVNQPEVSLADLASEHFININTIKAITSGNRHLWLKDMFPNEYAAMKNNVLLRKSINSKYARSGIKLISPDGEVHTIKNSISQFARDHDLQNPNLTNVINGRAASHRGWKLFKGD